MIYHKHVHSVSHSNPCPTHCLVGGFAEAKLKKETVFFPSSLVLVQKLYSRRWESSETCPQKASSGPGVQRSAALGPERPTLPARLLCRFPGELLQSPHVSRQGELQ